MSVNERAFSYVVLFLGVALLVSIGGIVALAALEKTIPDILAQASTGIVTGMIGLLVKTPTGERE